MKRSRDLLEVVVLRSSKVLIPLNGLFKEVLHVIRHGIHWFLHRFAPRGELIDVKERLLTCLFLGGSLVANFLDSSHGVFLGHIVSEKEGSSRP